MRRVGEQWVEESNGEQHMKKCVGLSVDMSEIIKDLGIIRDGCLPEERTGLYPEIENWKNETFIVSLRTYDVIVICYGNTLQEAKDAWNRRA